MDDASLRASDADREQALAALREHMVAGRLTLEEFCARADAALRAGVAGELAHLQDDLPDALMKSPGSRRRPARFTAALLGHVVRRGRFRLPRWAFAASAFGDLDFDLRNATMDTGQAEVTVLAAFGNVDIYVPEGVNVDVGGSRFSATAAIGAATQGSRTPPAFMFGYSASPGPSMFGECHAISAIAVTARSCARSMTAGVRFPAEISADPELDLRPSDSSSARHRARAGASLPGPDVTTPPGACAHEGAPWPVRRSPHGERRNMAPAGRYSMKAVS